jgi:hypothetical protein
VQKKLAQSLRKLGSTGFAGLKHRMPAAAELLGEPGDMSALASPVYALECNESAHHGFFN